MPHTTPAIPDPAWWCADPDRWELLEFDGRHDPEGRPFDARAQAREQVLESLVVAPGEGQGDFARYLLIQETHRHAHGWGFSHGLEIAGLLVAAERDVEDVWLLWSAVSCSFDTWCGMPHQVLLSAGAARTLDHVEASEHPLREDLAEHLRTLADSTDEEVKQELADRIEDYRRMLAEPAEP